MKNKKLALFKSAISLLLCLSMLAGSTFAWFTDEVRSGINTIAAGNLDVELYHSNTAVTNEQVKSDTLLFKDLQGDPILWEPGVVSYENLRIANEGDLALQYQLAMETENENFIVYPDGRLFGLSQVLKVGVVEGGITATDRAGVVASVEEANWTTLASFLRSGSLFPEGKGESEKTWGVVIYWEPGENDNLWNLNNGKLLSSGTELSIDLGVKLIATQMTEESDSFGPDYDQNATFPGITGGSITGDVPVENNTVTADTTLQGEGFRAVVPAGTKLADGVSKLTLSIREKNSSDANLKLNDNEILRPLDVHIEGTSADNTQPILVTIEKAMMIGLNIGNYKLYHVENGIPNEMTAVDAAELDAHNEFTYDPATGNITLALQSFSEVTVVADTINQWNGTIVNEFGAGSGKPDDPYLIANADQLAYLNKLVSDGDKAYNAASYKLLSDIVFAGQTEEKAQVWYPIGYRAKGTGTNKAGETEWYTYGGAFMGVFDGAGHKISNIYQNTWIMDGNYDNGYWKEAMGLFGYVYGGTVKNLTIDNFYSEGEFAPTGCVAAYAANATFENIAITQSHPQTYNTSVAAVVGRDGKNGLNDNDDGYNLIFRNITVDSSNTVSALWGSWDVGAAGLLGYLGSDSKVLLENCRVSPTIDVYNDVCGNYQYYWYRYCGMLIGTVDKTKADGSLDLSNIAAKNCTVDFGNRHEYYYCEFVKNSIASYTHDYQFSRVDNKDIVGQGASATCQNHNHKAQGTEIIDGQEVLVEDKQAVYIPFRQIFGGYGWGVKGTEITESGIDIDDITVNWTAEPDAKDQVKFESKFTGNFLYRVGNANTVSVGSLFAPKSNAVINSSGVVVSIDNYEKDANVGGIFKANASDWTKGTIQFSGTGLVKITIQDYDYCEPTELIMEVVNATNVAENGKISSYGTTSVLLGNTSVNTLYLDGGATLYGNDFTIDCTNSPISGSGSVSENYIIALVDAHLNNVKVIGKVYPTYGAQSKDDYNRALVVTKGNSSITNCYLSNTASPIRMVEGSLHVKGTTVKGGNFANIDVRNGHLIVEDVTTINQANGNDKADDGSTVIGLGIVVYYENVDPNLTSVEIRETLTQNNLISQNDKFSHEYANQFVEKMMGGEFSAFQTTVNGVKWVNSGVITMSGGIEPIDSRTNKDNYQKKTVIWSSNTGCLYTKAPDADAIGSAPSDSVDPEQGTIAPDYSFDFAEKNYIAKTDGSNDYCYYEGGKVLIAMDQGDTFNWDPFILTVTKNSRTLDYTVSYNSKTYAEGEKIAFNTAGDYVITYIYTDWDNYDYNADGELVKKEKTYTKTVMISVTVVEPTTQPATFTFDETETEKITVNNNTYISAKGVSATDQKWGYITVNGTKIFYPIIEAKFKVSSNIITGTQVQVYYPVYGAVTITDPENGNRDSTSMTTDRLTVVNGMEAKYTDINSACVDISKLTKKGEDGEVWDFSASSTISTTTTYDKVLCYQSPSGLKVNDDTRNYDAITVAQFKYTDATGDYYYFIGYYMPNQNTSSSDNSGTNPCVTGDTLVTLANDTQKRIDQVAYTDRLLAWDFFNGEFTTVSPAIIFDHGYDNNTVIELKFSDGTTVKAVTLHQFFDANLNKLVTIDAESVADYVGHKFAKKNGNGYKMIELVDYTVSQQYIDAWGIISTEHYNIFVEDMLSTDFMYEDYPLFNYFEVGKNMSYDQQKLETDIEKYGLYTYAEFADYLTYEQFTAFNVQYFKISVGKGVYTYESILALIDTYLNN